MAYVLDTNVAFDLRDGVTETQQRVLGLGPDIALSVLTRVELEGGTAVSAKDADLRRRRLAIVLATLPILTFDEACADAYRDILLVTGFSRRKVVDRMIAAQAIVADATLVTLNGADFRDIPGLKLLEW